MPSYHYPFTQKCEHAIRQAEHLAVRLHHNYIGTEHLLLGLLRTECLAAYILRQHEVTEARVQELIERLVDPGGTAGGETFASSDSAYAGGAGT